MLIWAVPVLAQTAASRQIPAGHWAYEPLQRLRTRGYLAGLDPLIQPYRREEVARGLRELDPDTLPQPVAEWVRLLRQEFAAEIAIQRPARVGMVLAGGVRGASTDRLDALRPLGPGDVWPWAHGGGWIESGPLVVETGVRLDGYLLDDPDQRSISLRMGGVADQTYTSLVAGPAVVTLGRFSRNWGPASKDGLLVSRNPQSYPQLGMDVRLGRIALQSFTAELDTLAGTRRYLAANRFAYTTPRTTLALTEAVLYSGGGTALQFLNPFTVLQFEHENPPGEGLAENLMLGFQIWRAWSRVEVTAEGLLDDIDLSPASGKRRAPTRYALTAGVRWRPSGERLEAAVEYGRVSSYAYRSVRPADRFDYLGRGLGPNFADYDHLEALLDVFPGIPDLRLTPGFEMLRQGQGDFRTSFPQDTVFRSSPSLFLGVVERTYRLALRGRYQPRREFWVSWDVGHGWIRNAAHVSGASASQLEVLVSAGARLEFGGRIGPRP